MLLTAELLLNYQRCSRRAFLDVYGEASARDERNDYVVKLLQDSAENQRSVVAKLDTELESESVKPKYDARDWQAGFEATVALMAAGVPCIYQGVLLAEERGVTLMSKPDLLIKQAGVSKFGDWLYAPAEIKLSKRSKSEYQVVTAYHVKVLAAVQEAWCESAQMYLKDKGAAEIDLWEVLPRMEEVLQDCIAMLTNQTEPEVFISRNRCGLCHWYGHCYTVAKNTEHLSLLPGVTQSRYTELVNMNITDLITLSKIDPYLLENTPGFGLENARKLIRQSQATLHNQALPTLAFPVSQAGLDRLLEVEIPTATVELYFDIESEPSLDLIYLHGVLVVDRIQGTEVFHSLLAETLEEEKRVWQEFLDLVWAYPTAPIFHFCPYEVQTVNKLARQYGTPRELIEPLMPRFVDLHERVTRLVTLPVEGYALKSIARWMGFDWRDQSANGAQSIYWYAQWLASGDRSFLESIVTYNEDDCRATYLMKEWLVEWSVNFGRSSTLPFEIVNDLSRPV
jgi:predicted RecB family nuclease